MSSQQDSRSGRGPTAGRWGEFDESATTKMARGAPATTTASGAPRVCPACRYQNPPGSLNCGLCAALLVERDPIENSVALADLELLEPPRLTEDPEDQARQRARQARRRRARERRGHAVTGALTFAGLFALSGAILGQPDVGGLFQGILLGTVVGLPLGYLIAWIGGGAVKGALVSASSFALLQAVLLIQAVADGSVGGSSVLLVILGGFAIGSLPGALVGWHVSMSR